MLKIQKIFQKAKILFLLLAGVSVACSSLTGRKSYHEIEDLNVPLNTIKKCIAWALPGGIKKKSTNFRTFTSHYIDLNGRRWRLLSEDLWRASAKVRVSGDIRPYDVKIWVDVEERKTKNVLDKDFKKAGQSEPLAGQVSRRIQACIEDRSNRSDLIDEFRAF